MTCWRCAPPTWRSPTRRPARCCRPGASSWVPTTCTRSTSDWRGGRHGLRFALPTLASHPAPRALVSSAVTYNGNINAFLVEEVLDAQPPALRDLILTTSVPDTLTPGLLEELTGQPAAPTTLRLMRANVFLESAPGDESGLRYVPFFRSLVLAQLAHEAPERFRRLHRSVAAWYASEGRWDRAVAHLGATGARPDCGSLVVDHLLVGRLLCEGRGDPLRRLVATTPAPAVTGTDDHLLRATTALADGDHEGCSAHLEAVARHGGTRGARCRHPGRPRRRAGRRGRRRHGGRAARRARGGGAGVVAPAGRPRDRGRTGGPAAGTRADRAAPRRRGARRTAAGVLPGQRDGDTLDGLPVRLPGPRGPAARPHGRRVARDRGGRGGSGGGRRRRCLDGARRRPPTWPAHSPRS